MVAAFLFFQGADGVRLGADYLGGLQPPDCCSEAGGHRYQQ